MMKSRVSPKMMVAENVSKRLLNMAIYHFGYLLVKFPGLCIETYSMFDRILVKISRWFSCNFTQNLACNDQRIDEASFLNLKNQVTLGTFLANCWQIFRFLPSRIP